MLVNLKGLVLCSIFFFGYLAVSTANDDSDSNEISDRLTRHRLNENLGSCKEGDETVDECLHCICERSEFTCYNICNGKRRALLAGFRSERMSKIRTKRHSFTCTPGQKFAKDCNTCVCTPDGKNAICTMALCNVNFSDIQPTSTNEPSSS